MYWYRNTDDKEIKKSYNSDKTERLKNNNIYFSTKIIPM